MKEVAILGGTFNPIHIGHIIAAQEVLTKKNLDHVIFIPTKNPPHKNFRELASPHDRYEMVRLAIKDNPNFMISDIEFKRDGNSYTYDTLMQLKEFMKDTKFHLILGFDALEYTDMWKNHEEVFKMASFIVVNRANSDSEMAEEIEAKKLKYNARISVVKIPDINISSTEIRNRVCSGESIKYLVPYEVEKYILSHGLYRGEGLERL